MTDCEAIRKISAWMAAAGSLIHFQYVRGIFYPRGQILVMRCRMDPVFCDFKPGAIVLVLIGQHPAFGGRNNQLVIALGVRRDATPPRPAFFCFPRCLKDSHASPGGSE